MMTYNYKLTYDKLNPLRILFLCVAILIDFINFWIFIAALIVRNPKDIITVIILACLSITLKLFSTLLVGNFKYNYCDSNFSIIHKKGLRNKKICNINKSQIISITLIDNKKEINEFNSNTLIDNKKGINEFNSKTLTNNKKEISDFDSNTLIDNKKETSSFDSKFNKTKSKSKIVKAYTNSCSYPLYMIELSDKNIAVALDEFMYCLLTNKEIGNDLFG